MTNTTPYDWRRCGHASNASDTVDCRGAVLPNRSACLVHVSDDEREAYFEQLGAGTAVDHRGTTLSADLVARLRQAVTYPEDGIPRLGSALFEAARFPEGADFHSVVFEGAANFHNATLSGEANFTLASFLGFASFTYTRFEESSFSGVTFSGHAEFFRASFSRYSAFDKARFERGANFSAATFHIADFRETHFEECASFDAVNFGETELIGPVACDEEFSLRGAEFPRPVVLIITAASLSLERSRWGASATLRLLGAEVNLGGVLLESAMTVAADLSNAADPSDPWEEIHFDREPRVWVTSLKGVDAAHLTLTDIDLTRCEFAGAIHLDQLRLEGNTPFAPPPTGWHSRGITPFRWSRRRVITDEHNWRALVFDRLPHREQITDRHWHPGPDHPDFLLTPRPARIAALYRQLRKALEDGKNEPGAADFYYGECEMRRHDQAETSRAERWLLTVYWALSGYGLRASRALTWLGVAMVVTVLSMMLWGLPADSPKPVTSGRQVEAGQELSLTTDTPPPVNPSGPLAERLSTGRFEQAVRVVVNSVVFRSSGQDLTTRGTYIEMVSRVTEPVLLGFAVVAIRNRVKR